MADTLWEIPVPPTYIERVTFTQPPGRLCELLLETDEELGVRQRFPIAFYDVVAYRCTYQTSVTVDMIETAYGKLVRLGRTSWLLDLLKTRREYCDAARMPVEELQHLMICFDDGPCYEVICAEVRLPI